MKESVFVSAPSLLLQVIEVNRRGTLSLCVIYILCCINFPKKGESINGKLTFFFFHPFSSGHPAERCWKLAGKACGAGAKNVIHNEFKTGLPGGDSPLFTLTQICRGVQLAWTWSCPVKHSDNYCKIIRLLCTCSFRRLLASPNLFFCVYHRSHWNICLHTVLIRQGWDIVVVFDYFFISHCKLGNWK